MRILAISHLFPYLKERRYGIFVARQLAEIRRQGAEIVVIVPRVWCPVFLRRFDRWKDHNHRCPLCRFEGIETLSVPYVRAPGNWYNRWCGLAAFLAMKKRALELHRKKNFDVIYATCFFPDGDAAARLARYLNVPAACLGIGTDVNRTSKSSKTIYKHFVKTTKALDGTLACGQSVADGIKAVTGKNPLCVYGVLDLEEFSPTSDKASLRKDLGLPLDKTVVLHAGYLTKDKGVYELVEALCKIQEKRPDVMLVICGGGPEETGLRRIIAQKNIEHVIRMVGEVDPEEMSKWMRASDLFALASYSEGMPNVVMEAMACGLAVVATKVGGLSEAIGDCDGAVLVPPRRVEALEEAIMKVVNNSQLRTHMQVAGRKRAEERFGAKQNARRIMDHLAGVVERSKSGVRRGR